MINGERIARAEQVLQVVYSGGTQGYDRQLAALDVEREAFDNWLNRRWAVIKHHYRRQWQQMDPQLEPPLNTLFMHAFLVGLVAGRYSAMEDR